MLENHEKAQERKKKRSDETQTSVQCRESKTVRLLAMRKVLVISALLECRLLNDCLF